MEMEAVEIKTEPLDDYFNQINQEEVIIKSENEIDYDSIDEILSREPEVQLTEDWVEPKEEPPQEPKESPSPNRSLNGDRFRDDINSDLILNHCKFCNMFFKSRTALKLHERNCQYKNDCKLCGQKFVTSYALSTHLNKTHNRMMESQSPQKDATKSSLGRPPNVKTDLIDNQCDICDLKFANSRDLNNHKKKHNTCQQCGENFKSFDDLEEHVCENIVIKEEGQSETETPTKKIFRATNSMVVIPGEKVHTPIKSNAKVKTAKPKKRKSRVLFQEDSNESSDSLNENITFDNLNKSPKSNFTVVTKDTDFEAFAQQMMKGFKHYSEPVPMETESISDQILRKLQILNDGESKSNESAQDELDTKKDLIAKVDASHSENVIVDSGGNIFKILKENFAAQLPEAFIKDEPLDEADAPDEEAAKPKMPSPLPFIKDEPDATDSTDLLLEELFDRKAKSIAKERQTKFPYNPFIEPNGLGFKVKKEINSRKASLVESNITTKSSNFSSPPKKKKRSYVFKNKASPLRTVDLKTPKQSLAVTQGQQQQHISRRKALPHKVRDEILENITPVVVEKKNPKGSKKQRTKKTLPKENKLLQKPSVPKKILPKPVLKEPKEILHPKLPTLENSCKKFSTTEIYAMIGKEKQWLSREKNVIETSSSIATEESSSTVKPETDNNCQTTGLNLISTYDNACSGDNIKMDCTENHIPLKTEVKTCSTRNSTSESTADFLNDIIYKAENSSNQQTASFCGLQVPSNGELDFEQVIQTNKLPNFNNVIKTLTEEYKKAEKVKLEEVKQPQPEPPAPAPSAPTPTPTISETNDSQSKPELPSTIADQDKPSSLFFPLLDNAQSHNMVANALNEKYRYVWICPMCPRQYSQVRPFKKHLLNIHFRNSSELEGQSFEMRPELVLNAGTDETFCHICKVTLADNVTLRKHQVEMHKDQDLNLKQKKKTLLHRCYICSKMCASRSLLAEHMKSDCGKNPQHGCNVCDKKFHTKSTLTLHKTVHTGELPHSCSFCQKRFRTRGQLTVHTRTHTGEKPFPCKVCGQCFTHRETLIAHLSRHIDMKRYKCYGCDQFFSCISGLKTHRSVRPETCGRVELNARAVGPRVRVIKGNVIFEPQPIYNARLHKTEKPFQESHILDHNYCRKDATQTKKVSKQIKSESLNTVETKSTFNDCFF